MLNKLLTISALLFAHCAFADTEANRATLAELDAVKGIGPALSQRIVDQRQKALFIDWPDLIDRVHGIGNASAAKFSADGLTVNGKAFQGGSRPVSERVPTSGPPAAEKPGRNPSSMQP